MKQEMEIFGNYDNVYKECMIIISSLIGCCYGIDTIYNNISDKYIKAIKENGFKEKEKYQKYIKKIKEFYRNVIQVLIHKRPNQKLLSNVAYQSPAVKMALHI